MTGPGDVEDDQTGLGRIGMGEECADIHLSLQLTIDFTLFIATCVVVYIHRSGVRTTEILQT